MTDDRYEDLIDQIRELKADLRDAYESQQAAYKEGYAEGYAQGIEYAQERQ